MSIKATPMDIFSKTTNFAAQVVVFGLPRRCQDDDFLLYYKYHEASIPDFFSNLIGDPLLSCRSQAATESFASKDSTLPEKHLETSAELKHSAEAGKELLLREIKKEKMSNTCKSVHGVKLKTKSICRRTTTLMTEKEKEKRRRFLNREAQRSFVKRICWSHT
jgi:hypothetical protein